MGDNWKKLQKEVIHNDTRLMSTMEKKYQQLSNVMKDPDSYTNVDVASKTSVQHLQSQIEDLSINSHPPIEFTKKLQQLHDKIDSIYTLLETLSDRLNGLKIQFNKVYVDDTN